MSRIRLPVDPQNRDLAELARRRRYLGAFTVDPPAEGNEQNLWVRSDLDPPELRTYRNGVMEVLGSGGGGGEPGPPGPPGADGVSFVWRDAWDSLTDYAVNDVVSHGDAIWIAATDPAVGDEPGVSAAWQLMIDAPPGALLNVQVITSGSGNYTPSPGTGFIVLEMVGGGGGGSGADSAAGNTRVGGSGGGGAYLRKRITSNFAGAAYAVGAAGAGGAAGNNAGSNGGDTTFTLPASTVFTAGGGVGGGTGSDGTGSSISTFGGAGGTATNGDLNVRGGAAARGMRFGTGNAAAGRPGESVLGKFPTTDAIVTGVASVAGGAGAGYGCGGEGGVCHDTAASVAGGDGTAGVIIIWEYGPVTDATVGVFIAQDEKRRSSDVSINNTSWMTVDSNLDLTIPAAAGDRVMVGLVAIVTSGGTATAMRLDAVSLDNASAPSRSWATNGSIDASGHGIPSWIAPSAQSSITGSPSVKLIEAADLVGGMLTIRLRARLDAAGSRDILGSSSRNIVFWCVNLGPKTIAAADLGGDTIGPAFPGTPADGHRHFHTGHRMRFVYDNANVQWLSEQVFTIDMDYEAGFSADSVAWRSAVPFKGKFGIWLEEVTFLSHLTAAATWVLELRGRIANNTATVLASRSTASDASATWVNATVAINDLLDPSYLVFDLNCDEQTGTASISPGGCIYYRAQIPG